jgi:glutathione synthase/RimK-type ligase-like ATP-grasp enzyme
VAHQPLLCQFVDDVRPLPVEEPIDFRYLFTDRLKVFSSTEYISDKQVLILTRKYDFEASLVGVRLLARGIDYVRINIEDIPDQLQIRYYIQENSDPSAEFAIGKRIVDISKFHVVWLREFDIRLVKSGRSNTQNELAQKFCYEQWDDSFRVLQDKLTCEWINRPEANLRASNRLLQLSVARNFGFNIPSTLITNDPDAARAFYYNHDRDVVLKALHHHGIEIDGKIYSMHTRSITKQDLKKFDDLIYAPCIFQERLHKKSELRVTVVGEQVFASRINSQSTTNGFNDLHKFPITDVPKNPVQLDDATTERCLKIMKALDLRYGALDFTIDKKDKVNFLEINPTGDWYWVEHQTKQPITEAMTDLIENLI